MENTQEELKASFDAIQHDTRVITTEVLQEQLKDWTAYNFGERTAVQPLLGMIEELGEMCAAVAQDHPEMLNDELETTSILRMAAWLGKLTHAHLKSLQNIRGTAEEHLLNGQDATARLHSEVEQYWASLCTQGADSPAGDADVFEFIGGLNRRSDPLDFIPFPESTDSLEDGMGDITVYQADFANAMGINLQKVVSDTWLSVRRRDWRTVREPVKVVSNRKTLVELEADESRHLEDIRRGAPANKSE